MRISALAAVCVLVFPACSWSQTVNHGVANVALGGNSWGGAVIPGGLQDDTAGSQVFSGMKQQATVAPFCPGWVDLWGSVGPINDGDAVSWSMDVPQGPGHYHCYYVGTFRITWNWFYMSYTYSIDYGVTVTYVSGD